MVTGQKDAKSCKPSQVCIQELTSENYFQLTQQTGKMVVVLHYSSNCAACTTVGHVFMTVAHMARHIPNLTFARINVLTNTLPWHLFFDTLPSIIVHPHNRKGDSRVFDSSRPLTPANLMSFLVANLDPSHRLALALSTCHDHCREQVVQAVTTATTQLHHDITASTVRLKHVLDRLVKIKDDSSQNNSQLEVHYHLLVHTKMQLVQEIQKQRFKLHHLSQVQTLLPLPPEKNEMLKKSELLKSLQYILQASSNSKDKFSNPRTLHNEL